jgi:NTP pyrophosphatase (non-canonical NTP hydrolase)
MAHSNANSFVLIYPDDYDPDNPDSKPTSVRYDQFVLQLFKADTHQIMSLHAAIGCTGEAGELGDAIKREAIYGKEADIPNIIEELGDLRFYMQAVMNLYGINEQEVLQYNAIKLGKRYKDLRYTDRAAIARADKNPGPADGKAS